MKRWIICFVTLLFWFNYVLGQNPKLISDTSGILHLNLSNTLFNSSKYELALYHAQEAYQKISLNKESSLQHKADAAFIYGMANKQLGNDSSAIIYLDESIHKYVDLYPRGSIQEADSKYQIARSYFRLANNKNGYMSNALHLLTKSVQLRNQLLGELDSTKISPLLFLGTLLHRNFKLDSAILIFTTALSNIQHNYDSLHILNAGAYLGIANAYSNQSNILESIKNYELALQVQISNFRKNNPAISSTCNLLSLQYLKIKDYDKALNYGIQAKDNLEAKYKKDSISLAYIHENIGLSYLELNQYEKSLLHFNQSDTIFKLLGLDKKTLYCYICADFGKLYYKTKQYDISIAWFHKALDILIDNNEENSPDFGAIQLYIGRNLIEQGNLENAIQSINIDIDILTKTAGPKFLHLYDPFYEKARAYTKLFFKTKLDSHYRISLKYYADAIQIIEHHLLFNPSLELQKSLIADARPIYENYIIAVLNDPAIDAAYNESKLQKVWHLSESSRAFLLYSKILESKAKRFGKIPLEFIQTDSALQKQVVQLEIQKQSLISKNKLNETDTLVLTKNNQILNAKLELNALRHKIENEYPEYAQLKFNITPSSLLETQQSLLPDQTLLEFYSGDSNIIAFVINQNKTNVVIIKKDFDLSVAIKQIQSGLLDFHLPGSSKAKDLQLSLEKYTTSATLLHDKLFAPLQAYLKSNLIITPDDVLSNIPFEALLSDMPANLSNYKTYPFLINKYSISYTYSATLLHQMQNKEHIQYPTKTLLAYAPFYTDDIGKLKDKLNNDIALRFGLSPLEYSGEEVVRIAKQFDSRSDVTTGSAASKQTFIEHAAQYQILHLATHGKANQSEGEFSFLAFSDAINNTEEGLLTVGELYNLPLNADLVVLSACETATGEQQRGEGVISIARAFAYSGAKSIVASLWKVNDKATMEIMVSFYKELKSGKPKHIALTNAKRQYMKNNPGLGSHPFYWSSFIPLGDMSPIQFKN